MSNTNSHHHSSTKTPGTNMRTGRGTPFQSLPSHTRAPPPLGTPCGPPSRSAQLTLCSLSACDFAFLRRSVFGPGAFSISFQEQDFLLRVSSRVQFSLRFSLIAICGASQIDSVERDWERPTPLLTAGSQQQEQSSPLSKLPLVLRVTLPHNDLRKTNRAAFARSMAISTVIISLSLRL